MITYIADYYSKDETGMTKLLVDALKETVGMNYQEKHKFLKTMYLTHRQIGASEALFRLIPSMHLKNSNITCIFVQSGFPENRSNLLMKVTNEHGESKKYEDIEQINISSRDSGLPPISYLKVSGGIFKDMTIHDIDILRWLLNDEIDKVYAQGTVMIDRKVKKVPDYDTATMILKSKKGILCQLSNSRRQTGGFDQRIEVYCKKGNLNLTNIKKTSVQEINSKSEVFDNYPLSFIERYK